MKFLIIEDLEYKIESLQSAINREYKDAQVKVARSFQTGKRALKEFLPDVVLLDMTLPTSEKPDGKLEGRNRIFGGRDILAEMDDLGLTCKVVIVTQFDSFDDPPKSITAKDLFQQLGQKYPKQFVGGIYYSNVDSTWQQQLRRILKSLK
jgi:DNA-binding NarL/FixJ family response regulator